MWNMGSYGGKLTYQYDKIGNMTSKNRYGNYHYDDPDHVHAVTRIEADATTIDSYAYDANGNMTSGAGRILTYDYDNRPTSITYNGMAVVSIYDANGNRVKKITPTSTTTYIEQLYECKDGECTKYIFAGSQRIANTKGTETYYYHTDHLGSSSIMTDSSGNTAQDIYYYPYGDIKTNTGSEVANHKYTGQEYDAETGLYYYGARYYDPKLARFISADTIVPDPINPQALNRYSYVLNNPLRYTDPTGHGFFSDLWEDITDFFESTVGAVIEMVVGTAIAIYGSITWNPYVTAAGVAMITHGVTTLGGNANVSGTTQVASWGGGGGGGGGGPGSGVGGGDPIYDSLDPIFYYNVGDRVVDLNGDNSLSYFKKVGSDINIGNFVGGVLELSNAPRDFDGLNRLTNDARKLSRSLDVGNTQDVLVVYKRTHGGENRFEYHRIYTQTFGLPGDIHNRNKWNVTVGTIYGTRNNTLPFFKPMPGYSICSECHIL